MFLTKEEREEFSNLSQEVFGTRSKWQKILKNGNPELITHKVLEPVKGEDGQEAMQEKEVAKLTSSGTRQHRVKYYTPESLKTWMLEIKAQRDELIKTINEKNAELKAKAEEEKRIKEFHEQNGGSAL